MYSRGPIRLRRLGIIAMWFLHQSLLIEAFHFYLLLEVEYIFDDYIDFMVTGVSRTQHGGVCYAGSWNPERTLEKVDPDD